ncbi:UNVERIFIED_CONTAM: hypothetical protein NCL1_48143 [Trichonephila clavipes]
MHNGFPYQFWVQMSICYICPIVAIFLLNFGKRFFSHRSMEKPYPFRKVFGNSHQEEAICLRNLLKYFFFCQKLFKKSIANSY